MSTYGDIRTRFEMAMNEKMVPVNIDKKLIGTVDDNDEETKKEITNIVSSTGSKSAILDFLKDINFPEDQANNLFNILIKSDDIQKTADYLLARNIDISSILNKQMDANVVNNTLGLSGEASQLFYSFTWRTSPSMGPGEPWLSTILKDGRRPTGGEKGDVFVGDFELEVKGTGGRLKGTSGYGDAKGMRISLSKAVQNIAQEIGLNNYNVIDNGRDNFWNITKNQGRGLEANLKEISKQLGRKFLKSDLIIISNQIIEAFKSYLIKLDTKRYGSILIQAIKPDGSIDFKKWHTEMIGMYFEYYYELEDFDYLALTTKIGKFLITEPKEFKNLFERGIIIANGLPSFTDGAGPWAGSYGIELKS